MKYYITGSNFHTLSSCFQNNSVDFFGGGMGGTTVKDAYFLDGTGRQPMSCHIDDVISSGEYAHKPIHVSVPCVLGVVETLIVMNSSQHLQSQCMIATENEGEQHFEQTNRKAGEILFREKLIVIVIIEPVCEPRR